MDTLKLDELEDVLLDTVVVTDVDDVVVVGVEALELLDDVGMEYCVPVEVTALEVKTVAVLFCETDLYEDGDGNTGLDLEEDVNANSDLDVDTVITLDDGGT